MSPNPNAAQEELSFRKGQIIKIFGSRDMDGFYRGELDGRRGLVPSNMVANIDKEMAYGMQDLRLRAAAPPQPYPQRMPPADYESYHPSSSSRRMFQERRRSDNWPHNSSDPALNARYRAMAAAGNFSDYDSSASAERYAGGRPEDPRLRRMRFQQMKSRSLDHYRKDEFGTAAYRGHPAQVEPGELDRRPSGYAQPFLDRDRDRYRGSLDRRDRTRDYSLPARSPSEQEFLDRRRAIEEAEFSRRGGMPPPSDYYAGRRPEGVAVRPAGYPPPPEDYAPRRDGRYYDDRRRYDQGGDPYRYPDEKRQMEPDRFRSERELELQRTPRGREYPPYEGERGRPMDDRRDYPPPAAGPSGAVPLGYGVPVPSQGVMPPKDQFDQFYDQGGAPRTRKARAGGPRDSLRETAKTMVAKFDYDPKESSPNVDAENMELSFRSGDVIVVFGEVDEDGFYMGELGGQRGLVPSNFLELYGAGPSQQQPLDDGGGRGKRDGVTFSDSVMADMERKSSIPSAPQRQTSSGALPARAMAAGQAKAAGAKPAGSGKPPGVMKKADSTAGKTSGGKKTGDGGAKGSPATSRKVSQAQGPKKPGDNIKRK